LSQDETKAVGAALKADPKSVKTAERKMKALQTTVGTATQKVSSL